MGISLSFKMRFIVIPDLEMSVAETEDLISVLDDDVTELDALVSTLQEENVQLQQTVNFLLQRVAALEATVNTTENTLDGITVLFPCSLSSCKYFAGFLSTYLYSMLS